MPHILKLFERLVLKRLGSVTEQHLIPKQAGFRPGRSCTGQVLNLTQHIEDGFEKNEPTGVVFVDLAAAYDTVNHRILLDKLYTMTKDSHLTKLIQMLLENRRFYVKLNGAADGGNKGTVYIRAAVLAPVLFNDYTNEQLVYPGTRSFIYADDLGIAVKSSHIDKIEATRSSALDNLTDYYNNSQLKAHPARTQVSLFHPRSHNDGRKLSVKWNGVSSKHCDHPAHPGRHCSIRCPQNSCKQGPNAADKLRSPAIPFYSHQPAPNRLKSRKVNGELPSYSPATVKTSSINQSGLVGTENVVKSNTTKSYQSRPRNSCHLVIYVTGRRGSPSIGFEQGWGDANTIYIHGDTQATQTLTVSVEHPCNLCQTY